jgi:hypothetical protein
VPTFSAGILYIRRINALELRNTELFGFLGDKSDPYVELALGDKWKGVTPVKKSGGANVKWDMLDLQLEVNREILANGYFNVVVKDKNTSGDSVIGVGRARLRRAGSKLGTECELVAYLTPSEKSKKKAGHVHIFTELKEPEPEEVLTLKDGFVSGKLEILKIQTFNLKNTELLAAMGDLPDPYCIVEVGEYFKKNTEVRNNAGGDVSWNLADFVADVKRDEVLNGYLKITAQDQNTSGDTLIGTGKASLMKCGGHLGEVQKLFIELSNEKYGPTGRVAILARLVEDVPDPEIPQTFNGGQLHVKSISLLNLPNVEFLKLTSNDPYVKLKIKEELKATPVCTIGGGTNPVWDNLDFKYSCDAGTIRVDHIAVEVWDKNSARKDHLIGSCLLPLKRTGAYFEQDVKLVADLVGPKSEPAGRAVLVARLGPHPPKVQEELFTLPAGFDVGTLNIQGIELHDYKNTEWVGKPDPYVRVEFGDWIDTTPTKNSADKDVVWSELDMRVEVDERTLKSEEIHVTVLDENTTRGDALIGTATLSVRRLCSNFGKQVSLKHELSTAAGAVSGTIIIHAALTPLKLEDAIDMIPESRIKIANGVLTIKKIAAEDLRGGSIFGNQVMYL